MLLTVYCPLETPAFVIGRTQWASRQETTWPHWPSFIATETEEGLILNRAREETWVARSPRCNSVVAFSGTGSRRAAQQ